MRALPRRAKTRRYNTVGTEHHDQPLLTTLLIREAEARQIQNEREGRCAKTQIADEFTSIASVGHFSLSGIQLAKRMLIRLGSQAGCFARRLTAGIP
jgi:hypothetical protein